MNTTNEIEAISKRASSDKIILYFGATFCGPCRAMTPTLDEVCKTINIIKIDTVECPDLSNQEEIRAIPTFIKYVKGVEVERKVGAMSKEALLNFYNS